MKFKKGQSSLEFILLFTFILIVMMFISYLVGIYLIGVQEQRDQQIRDDVASLIITEFELLTRIEGGFQREIQIPQHLVRRFNFTFYEDQFVITDLEVLGDNRLFVYDLPGRNEQGVNFNYTINPSGEGVLSLKKEKGFEIDSFFI